MRDEVGTGSETNIVSSVSPRRLGIWSSKRRRRVLQVRAGLVFGLFGLRTTAGDFRTGRLRLSTEKDDEGFGESDLPTRGRSPRTWGVTRSVLGT